MIISISRKNAIDGNSSTFWHSNWSSSQEPFPHELQVDMGSTLTLAGFWQLPRQDNINGRVREYAFYVSQRASDWGSPSLPDHSAIVTGSRRSALKKPCSAATSGSCAKMNGTMRITHRWLS